MAVTALTAIGLGLAGFSAVRQVQQGRAAGRAYEESGRLQRASAESAARLSEFNAAVAELQAADAIARGAQEEARFRDGIDGLIGSQRAAIAANNIDVGFGSALDVQADAAYQGELDALTIRNNAAREAWGYAVQAQDSRLRAQIARREGVSLERQAGLQAGQARSSGYWGAGSTVLGAGFSMAERYGWGAGRGRTFVHSAVDATARQTLRG